MLSVPLFGVVYLRCLSSFWRCGHFRCRLVQLPQWSGCTAFLFADELTEDFFNRLHHFVETHSLSCVSTIYYRTMVKNLGIAHRCLDGCCPFLRDVSKIVGYFLQGPACFPCPICEVVP